ncbi:toxin/drug exporter TdeA [Actinobacillus suis]|uniref:Outer membrane protein n=2 Tax=Actinobacillus suis TaxID=716 RepID=K0FVK6_ACTSU|nr:TolC family protein [Actinobacillus suis]AFU18407.1 outer membrane protein [Actinobacillus suis H91-0380]AIJ30543.1 outer membrane protein [Actinobacillus suis ATCC 33415]MCO4167324.1 TolC family protein [Actinobacillus suis]MCO4169035.1 TolC family protein [Actinobacillus suis]MCQ9630082.1 TolC family protein [Actinobacillus suis]
MKLSKLALTLSVALALSACSTNMSKDGSLEQAQATYQQYQEITKQFQINEQWWRGYNDNQLNTVIDQAIANNLDLAKSAIAVNKALYNANLVGANLVPTFSGSGSTSASKGVGSTSNQVSTGVSTISNKAAFNLSYTLDLWRRLADTASAAEWEHKATIEDLKSARLSLINSVVTTYYQIAYYKDAISVIERTIKNYEQISRILNNKLAAGAIDRLAVEQAQQATLNARNNLIAYRTNLKTAEQTLRNLLNLKPNQSLPSRYPSILAVKLQGVDLNVPVSAIANRPDVTARLNRLQSAFNSLTATEKSWFPTVTLGASISGNTAKAYNVADNPVGNGVLSFDLPFLDWNRVKNNVKISESDYMTAKLNYEQTLTSALNEIDTHYYTYEQARSSYATLQKAYEHDKRISTYYKNRYEQGASEFREWIAAMNTELSSQLSILNQKYTILSGENTVYQSMAGKYIR